MTCRLPDANQSEIPAPRRVRAQHPHVTSGLLFDYFTQYAKVRVSYRGDFLRQPGHEFRRHDLWAGLRPRAVPESAATRRLELPEELFLYGFSLIPYGMFNVLSLNLYDFGNDYIIEGKFDRVLLRPISSLFQMLFETFRIESVQEVVTGSFLHVVGRASAASGVDVREARAAHFFRRLRRHRSISSIFLILTTVSFWFEDRIGIHPPVWNVIAFGRYPLSIYSGAVQFFLCWIIPFGLASFYPSVRMLGRAVVPEYAPFVPVVAAVFLAIAISLWNFGTRHYSSTGS